MNDCDAEEFVDNNDENINENYPEDDIECKTKKRKQRMTRLQSRKNKKEHQKKFNQNLHLFNMSCDCCSKIFESLDEARTHYSAEHNNPKGYIKSKEGNKIYHRWHVLQHIDRHHNPDNFKYVPLYFIRE